MCSAVQQGDQWRPWGRDGGQPGTRGQHRGEPEEHGPGHGQRDQRTECSDWTCAGQGTLALCVWRCSGTTRWVKGSLFQSHQCNVPPVPCSSCATLWGYELLHGEKGDSQVVALSLNSATFEVNWTTQVVSLNNQQHSMSLRGGGLMTRRQKPKAVSMLLLVAFIALTGVTRMHTRQNGQGVDMLVLGFLVNKKLLTHPPFLRPPRWVCGYKGIDTIAQLPCYLWPRPLVPCHQPKNRWCSQT